MKQLDNKDAAKTARPLPQPVSILRRSSTGASKNSAVASLNPIDSEYDASDRTPNNNSFDGDDNNYRVSHVSNFAPITDANELADRLINFKKSVGASAAGNNDKGNQSNSMRGHPRPPPPPPPPRPSSSGQPRSEVMNPPAKDQGQQRRRRSSEGSLWSDATEDEYVRRMARIQLEQSDRSVQGNASSEYSSELQNREKNTSSQSFSPPSKNPPPPPSSAKNDETRFNDSSMSANNNNFYSYDDSYDEIDESYMSVNSRVNESSMSVNSNKFNSSSMSVNSNKSPLIPRPVRVSQFEDNDEPGTPTSKPKTAMAISLSSPQLPITKNIATPSDESSAHHSSPQNCDKRGRCKLHPQYKLYKKKLLGGYEFISNCPVCVAKSRGSNRTKSGDYSTASAKSPSAKMSGRNSRSRERARSKSADRIPNVPNLDYEDDDNNDYDTSKRPHSSGPGRMRTRAKSVEQRRLSHSQERLRRTRTLSRDKDRELRASNGSSSSRGKKVINALENIRDRFPTPSSVTSAINSQHEGNLRQRRSRSREERRLPDDERGTLLLKGWSPSTKNLEKGIRALQQRESGSSKDKPPRMSASYDETTSRKKKNMASNPFVRQTDVVHFDKKTGRCKKHPSIILAKKSTFRSGSWEIIKKNGCPLCSEARVDSDLDELGQGFDEDTKKKMEILLKGGRDDGSFYSNPTLSNQQIIDSIPPEGLRGRKVSKLHYTTPLGETGWYTGEVDSEGIPHGHGRMRFKTGHSYEGEWNHGYSEVHMDNLNRIKSGFGSNKAAWKQSEIAPSVRKAAAAGGVKTPDAAKLMSTSGAMYQYQQRSPHQGYSPAQMQQAQLQQAAMVSQAAWANMSPQERQMAMTQWYASNGMSPVHSDYQMQGYPPI